MFGQVFGWLFNTFANIPRATITAWQWVTWHSTVGAILVPLVALAAGLVLSRITHKGDKR